MGRHISWKGGVKTVTEVEDPVVAPPTPAEQLAAWRAEAKCSMLALQDYLIDAGLFDAAETASATVAAKWHIRWEARSGVTVDRSSDVVDLDGFAALIGLTPEQVDTMPIWQPPYPEGLTVA